MITYDVSLSVNWVGAELEIKTFFLLALNLIFHWFMCDFILVLFFFFHLCRMEAMLQGPRKT